MNRFVPWLGIGASKFYDWKARFGQVNEHNAWVPRDHWLTEAEKERICAFARQHPLEGYRRLTFMMLDQDVVACSPASVYRVLKNAGLLAGQTPRRPSQGDLRGPRSQARRSPRAPQSRSPGRAGAGAAEP